MPQQSIEGVSHDVFGVRGTPDSPMGPAYSSPYTDPVGKLRVSTPQSLIDTDFEYGAQSTKWESLNLINNRPSCFYDTALPIAAVTAVAGAGARTVTVSTVNTPALGTAVYVQSTTNPQANGWFIVDSVSSGVSFTYTAFGNISGSIFDSTKTYIFSASLYTGAAIPAGTTAFTFVGNIITVTTTNAHGLLPGSGIFATGLTATTNPPNGSWSVRRVLSSNSFDFVAVNTPTGTITSVLNASLYARPYGFIIHRSFDGGVEFSAGYPVAGNQLIRQTRRYFRYQSGKGIQFATGTILKPQLGILSLTSSGATVTVNCSKQHNLAPGASVKVAGCAQTAYNGTFVVLTTPTDLSFTYLTLSTPSATPATAAAGVFFPTVNVDSWLGGPLRCGVYDEQNGLFWEWNGSTLSIVRRSSTTQLTGTIAVSAAGAVVTGTNTLFSSQLTPGDYIVIRGHAYMVRSIISDTSLVIGPEYRGISAISNCIASKRVEERIVSTSFNLDKLDGKGYSAFTIDTALMQMLYIDFSWYGAGAVRFGLRDQKGTITYVHILPNSNRNTEAFMRSGNLPARYETNTLPTPTTLSATLASGTTASMSVVSTAAFPASGTVLVIAPGNTGAAVEAITYTSKTATTLDGLTRGVQSISGPGGLTNLGGSTAQTFTFSATAPIAVQLLLPQHAPSVNHWGSAVVMDGRFDNDKEFQFNAPMATAISNLGAGTSAVIMAIRLAPSVDSGLTGLLGDRDLINRMQVQLTQLQLSATGAGVEFRIDLVLNGVVSGGTTSGFATVGGSSLCQVAFYTAGGTHAPNTGELVYTTFVQPGVSTPESLLTVRDMGNSILGGGVTNNVSTGRANVFPDGPDTMLVKVTNVGAVTTNTIRARLAWAEAQA